MSIEDISDLDDAFDFENVAITEKEYEQFLESLFEWPAIEEVSHSVGMNEVSIAINGEFTGSIESRAFPEGVTISHVNEWNRDSEDDTRRSLRLRTTRWFGGADSDDEHFPGEYSDEAMAALQCELELFEEVSGTAPVKEGTEVHIEAELVEDTDTSGVFKDVQTILGYSISKVSFENGAITRLGFEFDESRVWTRANYEKFQRDKLRWLNKAHVDQIEDVPLPCGHTSSPTTQLISDVRTSTVQEFPLVSRGLVDFLKIPIQDMDEVLLTISEWPDGTQPADSAREDSIPVSPQRGFLCTECSIFYCYSSETRHVLDNMPTVDYTDSTVCISGVDYEFTILPIPALPIGFRDAYPDIAPSSE